MRRVLQGGYVQLKHRNGLLRRCRSLPLVLAAFFSVAGGASLTGCSQLVIGGNETHGTDIDVFDKVRAIDLLPRFPQQRAADDANTDDHRQPAIYSGTMDSSARDGSSRDAPAPSASGGEGYDLSFENAPIANVAKVVLGDILGVGYTIDPRVQGTVTLASGRPVPKSDMLYVLETALRMSNVVLVRDTAGYRLGPLGEAVGGGPVDRGPAAEPGYGISVIPLQHVSAQTLIKLLDSFAFKPGTVRADPGRNILIIQGSGSERRLAVDTAQSFDADWMRGQSVGIYPVRNSTPEPMIAELEKILDSGEGGLGQNMVKFQVIGRQNAILAVARKPEVLKTVSTWITRLDKADARSTGVRVYNVRYGEARQLARVLNDIFTGSSGSSAGLDSATNQIAPGSGYSVTSSSDRLTLGGDQQSQSGLGVRQQLGVDPRASTSLASGASANRTGAADTGSASPTGPAVLPGVRITADAAGNKLLIYASQDNYRIIERTLRQLDRPQLQVGIDATIAEVTLNDNLNYGVQFFLTSRVLGLNPDTGSLLNTHGTQTTAAPDSTGVVPALLSRAAPGFNFLLGTEAQPTVILDALHNVTDVKVLSSPSVVVLDNQVATLLVGDQVPVSTGSATVLTTSNTVVNTIDYRNTGIILRVIPRINVNGNVLLDVEQEISNVSNTSTANTLTPTVSQRKVKSSVVVASGQTVLLAGLISERREKDRPGIPGLEQLPVVGDAFSHSSNTTTRTELIIFIRPQIIRDSVDAHFVAEELRSKLRGSLQSNTPPHESGSRTQ
jgi:general secretion pathway protein D